MTNAPEKLTREDVAHLARLARLDLDDAALDHHAEQLGVIITSIAQISEVAADGVEPMSHPVALLNVFREDVVRPSLDRAETLAGAPAAQDDRFLVPRILDEE